MHLVAYWNWTDSGVLWYLASLPAFLTGPGSAVTTEAFLSRPPSRTNFVKKLDHIIKGSRKSGCFLHQTTNPVINCPMRCNDSVYQPGTDWRNPPREPASRRPQRPLLRPGKYSSYIRVIVSTGTLRT